MTDHLIRYSAAKKITLLGALSNALLGLLKLVGGTLYHSHALVADGLHSFSDLLTDLTVLFASKYSSHAADVEHPYGHQRIETAGTLLLALLLILTGFGIAWDSIQDILQKIHSHPSWLTLPIACVSIVANEALFYYTRQVGERIQSPLITANAWHHRSDAAASVVVLLGLIGSLMGWPYLDALAAVIVGGLIIQMGMHYAWNSVKELIDTGVEPQLLKQITKTIQHVDGVCKIHQLRTRLMGQHIFIDVHILVSPYISVSEGHFIAQQVHHALMKTYERIQDVTVHVDPEDDELTSPSLSLPSRRQLTETYLDPWHAEYPMLSCLAVHYLHGQVTLDLLIQEPFTAWDALQQSIQASLKLTPLGVKHVRFFSSSNANKPVLTT